MKSGSWIAAVLLACLAAGSALAATPVLDLKGTAWQVVGAPKAAMSGSTSEKTDFGGVLTFLPDGTSCQLTVTQTISLPCTYVQKKNAFTVEIAPSDTLTGIIASVLQQLPRKSGGTLTGLTFTKVGGSGVVSPKYHTMVLHVNVRGKATIDNSSKTLAWSWTGALAGQQM